jgi:hypothetical protein
MAGTVVADQLEAASTSTLVLKNGVANTPPTIQDSAGTEIGTLCRAWVNFNGTLVAASMIRASFNVSSITDLGTGEYTVNFTNALPDANYVVVSLNRSPGLTSGDATQADIYATSSIGLVLLNRAGSLYDPTQVNVAIFR